MLMNRPRLRKWLGDINEWATNKETPMKIVNEKPKQSLYIYCVGRGDDTMVVMKLIDPSRYADRPISHISFDIKQAREFMKSMEPIMAEAEQKYLVKETESDDE